MKHHEMGRVTTIREIRPDIWSMWLQAPSICRDAVPGQFLHVRVKQTYVPLLRRPLSIGRVHGDQLELVWRVVGEGTRLLAEVFPGDRVDLLGPLGHGFTLSNEGPALLVGGGLGLPPLVYLYDELRRRGSKAELLLGVRGAADIPLAEDDPVLDHITITAELGEGYEQGLVTAPTQRSLESHEAAGELDQLSLYTCGPWGLVTALQGVVPEGALRRAEVSLEQQMGCAMGVCQGCAVRAAGGKTPYRLVCHDGPVFPLFDVEAP
ncbi:hypothetical protein GF324_00660 [bacterium]|nr:hypothetical protein [bacterium]